MDETPMDETPNETRINKWLSEVGFCSRRAADKLIERGLVTINGKVPELGTKIKPGDEVHVNGKLVVAPDKEMVYIAFNKPVGIVCTTDTRVEKDNIIDYIKYPTRIFPIGRLDKPSEGLIFLTNDGDIVNKILRARNNHEKEYIVTVNKPVTAEFIEDMANGVPILDTVTRKCFVEQTDIYQFRIILTQGLNRQIRRMCEHFEYRVTTLRRTRIMNVNLDVPKGKWRDLTADELAEIHKLVAESTKTYDPDEQIVLPERKPFVAPTPKAAPMVSSEKEEEDKEESPAEPKENETPPERQAPRGKPIFRKVD